MTIKEMLSSGFIILDGAMGTQMQQRGLPVGQRPETLSLTHPEIVAGIHKDYIKRIHGGVYQYLWRQRPQAFGHRLLL